jgi:hypothetical protein
VSTFTSVETFTTIECTCGFIFAVPDGYERRLRETHDQFFCPKGHSLSFTGASTAERLRLEIEAEKRRTEYERERATRFQEQRIRAEHQLRTVKGHQTRLKKRIASGACPCCNRTFENLARHMTTQHPGYADGAK